MTTEPMVRVVSVICTDCGFTHDPTSIDDWYYPKPVPASRVREWTARQRRCDGCNDRTFGLYATEPV